MPIRVAVETLYFDYMRATLGQELSAKRDRDKLPEGQSIDVPFHVFMADDMAMVEQIYQKAELPMNAQARTELQQFIDDHPRGKHGRMVYDLEGDFGVSPDQLRERFQFYFDRFPARPE